MIDGKQIKDGTINRSKFNPIEWGLTLNNLTPETTSGDNSDTGLDITYTPTNNGYVGVFINGTLKQLGDGVKTKDCYFAPYVPGPEPNFAVGSYAFGNAFILNGRLWATGNQAGDNTITNRSSPVSVVGNHSFRSIGITGYGAAVAGLKSDGTVWGWGDNNLAYLGDNSTDPRSSPVSVVGNHSFVQMTTGINGGACLKSDGTCWTWGRNNTGTCGDNTITARSSPVSVIGAHSFVILGTGGTTHGGIKSNGTAWLWGHGTSGNCGDGANISRSSPVSVVGAHSFIQLVFNDSSFGRKADGTLWAWGANTSGGLADGTSTSRNSPVSTVGAHLFIQVSGGNQFGAGLKSNGTAWAWGFNSNGQVGDNSITNRSSPVSVIGAHSFVKLFCGRVSVLGYKSDGTVWGWGRNLVGALGDGTVTDRSSPVLISGNPWYGEIPDTARSIADITAGDSLFWNATIAAQNLTSADRVDLMYVYSS